ncbi:hypothetical protein D3C78_1811160 [compost metagenome]
MNLGDGEAVIELDEVDHPPGNQVRDPLPHIGLRVDHMVRANTLGYFPMFGCQGLDPDIFDPQFGQRHDGHQAGCQVGAYPHDGMGKVGNA